MTRYYFGMSPAVCLIPEPLILREESDFLLVHKPPHLISHPTRPDGAPSVLGWLQARYPGEFIALINRLDRETSGVILVARSPEVASLLGKLTMQRAIHKDYLAVVFGRMAQEQGLIQEPLGRLGINAENPIWLRQGVIPLNDSEGRKSAEARSEYWRLAVSAPECEGSGFSLVRLQAHTGRLHQLRVHLAHVGHPVVGDKIYGPDPLLYLKFIEHGWTEEHARLLLLPRQALHAAHMSFDWQGTRVEVTSPLPGDLQDFAREVKLQCY